MTASWEADVMGGWHPVTAVPQLDFFLDKLLISIMQNEKSCSLIFLSFCENYNPLRLER